MSSKYFKEAGCLTAEARSILVTSLNARRLELEEKRRIADIANDVDARMRAQEDMRKIDELKDEINDLDTCPQPSGVTKTFGQWRKDLDELFWKHVGLSYMDMPDQPYRDYFDDGMSPEAALAVICADESCFEQLPKSIKELL